MQNWRINLVVIFFFVAVAIVAGRLFSIQVLDYGLWKARAQGQHISFAQVEGNRGEIFLEDNSGINLPLAINKEQEYVYVSPKEIYSNSNIEEVAKSLSDGLSLEYEFILQKLSNKDRDYEFIKNKLSKEEVGFLEEAKDRFQGIYVKMENVRYYPQEEFASQVIGFLGGENSGQYGIEGYYNDLLEGQDGFQVGEKNVKGFLTKLTTSHLIAGSDLILTLDYNVQFMAEKLLKEAKENLNFESGQIIVMDPNSGKIITMAQYPSFNPNEYSKEKDISVFKNSTLQKIFEPGSIFKPITMFIGLATNKVTPETRYYDTGSVQIGGYAIRNFAQRSYGEQTMTQVLEKSINTGAVFAEKSVGHSDFLKYIEDLKLFGATNIDLQGEIASSNSSFKRGYEINFATASFGQGVEMTPIQILRTFSVILNGGKLIKPYVVDKIIENEKEIIVQPEIEEDLNFPTRAVEDLKTMLVSVIENGYSTSAKIPGYYMGGKTGTAQVSWSALGVNKSGYSDKTIQSFIGFAPAYNPRFIILVKLDNPQTMTAEYSAAPIFKQLSKYIIDLWQIPPDYTSESM